MIHQRFNPGEIVRLDKDFTNSSLVRVNYQSPMGMYTNVQGDKSSWNVMTSRLSRLENANDTYPGYQHIVDKQFWDLL